MTTPNNTGAVTIPKVPAKCRERLHREGKPYPRSGCEACGKFAPRWQECEVLIRAERLAATPPEGAPAVDGGDAVRLYHAVNRMMAALGAEGEVSTRHRTVQQVMDELARIDGGAYDETLAAAPAPAVDGGGAEWVLVPRTLTDAMFATHLSRMSVMRKEPKPERWHAIAQASWTAMLAAATRGDDGMRQEAAPDA